MLWNFGGIFSLHLQDCVLYKMLSCTLSLGLRVSSVSSWLSCPHSSTTRFTRTSGSDKILGRPDTVSKATYRKRNLRKSCNACGGLHHSSILCVCVSKAIGILRNSKLTRNSSFLYSVGIIIQANQRCKFGVRGQRAFEWMNPPQRKR